jgi:hypothetical protein
MTEKEWLNSTDPRAMLKALRPGGRASDRKLRLFMAACCRRVVHTFIEDDDEGREGYIEVAERYADGLADEEERDDALGEATDGGPHRVWDYCTNLVLADFTKTKPDDADGIDCAIGAVEEAWLDAVEERYEQSEEITQAECAAQAELLRCVFGPLAFRRPPRLAAALRKANDRQVEKLAGAAYELRSLPDGRLDNTRLAVLADALEEAGCSHVGLLTHLRSPGVHVRGCWAVDHLLKKE